MHLSPTLLLSHSSTLFLSVTRYLYISLVQVSRQIYLYTEWFFYKYTLSFSVYENVFSTWFPERNIRELPMYYKNKPLIIDNYQLTYKHIILWLLTFTKYNTLIKSNIKNIKLLCAFVWIYWNKILYKRIPMGNTTVSCNVIFNQNHWKSVTWKYLNILLNFEMYKLGAFNDHGIALYNIILLPISNAVQTW